MELTQQEQARLKKPIIDEVGLARVTIQYCKKCLKFLRRLAEEGVLVFGASAAPSLSHPSSMSKRACSFARGRCGSRRLI